MLSSKQIVIQSHPKEHTQSFQLSPTAVKMAEVYQDFYRHSAQLVWWQFGKDKRVKEGREERRSQIEREVGKKIKLHRDTEITESGKFLLFCFNSSPNPM